MPEMHLEQPGCTYNAANHLQKSKKESGDSQYIYQNELDKAYFQHGMANGDFKVLTRRVGRDKTLRHKAFNIAKI